MSSQPTFDAATVRPGWKPNGDRTLVRLALFQRWPTAAPLLIGAVLVTLVAGFDEITGRDLSVEFLYVATLVCIAWIGSLRSSILIAVLAAAESVLADLIGNWDLNVLIVANAVTRLAVMLFVAVTIGSLRNALARQRHLAMVDPLTGALNRRSFTIAADRERMRSARDGRPITVAYLDLDDFKAVNDRHGHKVGDDVLRMFAETVSGSIRGTDLFSRIGGDEFVVMLPDTGAKDAITVMKRISSVLGDYCCIGDQPVTASIGIMTFQVPPKSVDVMVGEADRMMYQAKAIGPGQIVGAVAAGPWMRWATESMRPNLSLVIDDRDITASDIDDVVVELFK